MQFKIFTFILQKNHEINVCPNLHFILLEKKNVQMYQHQPLNY